MTQIILAIIGTLLMVYIWIWIIDTIFSHKKIKITLTLQTIFLGFLLVGSLFTYEYLLTYIGLDNNFFRVSNNATNILIFISYCLAFLLLISIFYGNIIKKRSIRTLLIGGILFVMLGLGAKISGMQSILVYYLIAAYAEEYLKYSTGENMYLKTSQKNKTNLILFCILIGLGFSITENILYITQSFLQNQSTYGLKLLIGRGLISTLIHVIATGSIAYITIKRKTKIRTISLIILAMLVGFGLHAVYNLSLHFQLQIIIVLITICGYFLLTWLMFQSDLIYSKNK